MRAFFFELSQAYQLRFLGRTMPVLWENTTSMGPDTWQMSGLTDNYLRVNADAPRHLWNQLTPVHLTGLDNGELVGAIST